MNVEWKFGGTHPIAGNWIGCVTTDDPKAFCEWLDAMMPSHTVVQYRARSAASQRVAGGYLFRINLHCEEPAEQLAFTLTWKGSK